MTYKQTLTKAMNNLVKDPLVRFVGYNTAKGPRMNGTLVGVPVSKCIETPVAENLMCGIAMGLALEGYRPVLCFERMDFTLACMDAILNHIDALPQLGNINLPMTIRVTAGTNKPLDPGIQHRRDYTALFSVYARSIGVYPLCSVSSIREIYSKARNTKDTMMLIDYKEMYDARE